MAGAGALAITFVATSNMVLLCGLEPVFVDVDPYTYNIGPAQIEKKITARTRAIMPVHLFGLPCAMDSIMDIAARHDLRLFVEDVSDAADLRVEDVAEPVHTVEGSPPRAPANIGRISLGAF